MIDVSISAETEDRLHKILEGLGESEEKVLKPALSRGLTAGKTAFNKQIAGTYYITLNKLSSRYAKFGYKSITTEGDRIIGSIAFSGGAIPLYKFSVSPSEVNNGKSRKTVSAAIFRNKGPEAYEDAFIAEMHSKHMGVFERKGEWIAEDRITKSGKNTGNNELIKQLYGPSLAGMAKNAVILENVEERVNEVINNRIQHEIERLLNSGG